MAEIISFQEMLRARRRQVEVECIRQCLAIIEENLKMSVREFATAPLREKPVRARKIRKLGELLEYAAHLL